jgi:hypothetical protein
MGMNALDTLRQFIYDRPDVAGYAAVMVALALTGRVRLVILGLVLGFVTFYCYSIGTACATGTAGFHHGLIAIAVSVTVILLALRFAFR